MRNANDKTNVPVDDRKLRLGRKRRTRVEKCYRESFVDKHSRK